MNAIEIGFALLGAGILMFMLWISWHISACTTRTAKERQHVIIALTRDGTLTKFYDDFDAVDFREHNRARLWLSNPWALYSPRLLSHLARLDVISESIYHDAYQQAHAREAEALSHIERTRKELLS